MSADDPLDEVVKGLLAERYAPSVWWSRGPVDNGLSGRREDTPTSQAARRKLLEEGAA